jgi:hypothetical protein
MLYLLLFQGLPAHSAAANIAVLFGSCMVTLSGIEWCAEKVFPEDYLGQCLLRF